MDRFLLVITIFNYVVGISLEKYLLHLNNYTGATIVIFPFLWFGFIIIILKTKSAIRYDIESNKSRGKEKLLPNMILLILNALFPLIGLILLGSK